MRSLFVRLFLWFWLTALLSGAIFFLVAMHFRPVHHHLPPPSAQFGFPPPAPPPPRWRFLEGMGVQLGISALVGGLICYLLAWRITAPVRRLRQVVQQLAAGDLTVRTGIGLARQGDEIADLGRDFDRMAERIETLLLSQKQLVRDISHELRSPLARLQVALGLTRRAVPPEAERLLDRIEQEGERLNALIGELLTLSLLENGTAMADREPVELQELLAEVVEDALFEAAESGRQVRLAATPALVEGNRELLRRAVENVVRNALRYTAEGTAVMLSCQRDGQGDALLTVQDQGPGVPEQMLAAIFQPFYRVAEARDRQSGGTGIGLAITARTLALHGGTVTARNRPEGGLEVAMRLPLAAGRGRGAAAGDNETVAPANYLR